MIHNKNIIDYEKFLSDMCEKHDDYECLPYDMVAAYRIWCKKSLTHEENIQFRQFIKNSFMLREKYYEQTGMRHKVAIGIQLKKLEFLSDDPSNVKIYEKFCIESCITDYTFKITITDFLDKFSEWMKKTDPSYTMSPDEVAEIKEYFKRKYMFDNESIFGIQMKSDKLPYYHQRNMNKIYMINENKDIVTVFNGLSDASHKLNMEPKKVSDTIRYSKTINYEDEIVMLFYEKGHNVIKKRNVESKTIYKFDFATKELLQTFNSTVEASSNLEITTSTVMRYISIAHVFQSKKDGNKNIILSYLEDIKDVVPKQKTKVVKYRAPKLLYTYIADTKELFQVFNGPFDAANKLVVGQCTVHRHIKNEKPLKIVHQDKVIPIVFTYTKCG